MSSLDVSRISEEEILLLKNTLFSNDSRWLYASSNKRNVIDTVCSIIKRASVEELASFISWSLIEDIDGFKAVYATDSGVSNKLDSAKREFKKNYISGIIKSFEDGTTSEFLGDLSSHELLVLKISIQNWNIFNSKDVAFSEEDLQRCCRYLDDRRSQLLEKRDNYVADVSGRYVLGHDFDLKPDTDDYDELLGSDFDAVTNSDGSINITAIAISAYTSDVNNVRIRFNDALFWGAYFIEQLKDDSSVSLVDKALMLTEFALSSKSNSFEKVKEPIFNCIAGYLFDKELVNTKILDVPVMGIIRDKAPILYDKILSINNVGSVEIPEYSKADVTILENMFGLAEKENGDASVARAIDMMANFGHSGGSKK